MFPRDTLVNKIRRELSDKFGKISFEERLLHRKKFQILLQ